MNQQRKDVLKCPDRVCVLFYKLCMLVHVSKMLLLNACMLDDFLLVCASICATDFREDVQFLWVTKGL